MGVLYNANYLRLFEMGRTELLRKSGLSYDEFEKMGFILPVARARIEFKKPVKYDEPVDIITSVKTHDRIKITFDYEIRNSEFLLAAGETVHTTLNRDGKLIEVPEFLVRILEGERFHK